MEILVSPYSLTPKRKANHLADTTAKQGVYLKVAGPTSVIADYFPHVELGDQSVSDFLATFPDHRHPYHLSILAQLKAPMTPLPEEKFLNHQLWVEGSEVLAPVVKYKITKINEVIPERILASNCQIRLDANGLFNEEGLFKFLSQFSIKELERFEYLEDPGHFKKWSTLPIMTARDFLEGDSFDALIYKPNRDYQPELKRKTIFSGYMGSSYGLLHAYRELVSRGDLGLYHGLLTPGLYQEEKAVFKGNYLEGFYPDPEVIREMEAELQAREWRPLCSI